MSNWEIHNNSFTDCNRGIAISGKHNNITQNTFVRVDMPISGGVRGSENSNCSACGSRKQPRTHVARPLPETAPDSYVSY